MTVSATALELYEQGVEAQQKGKIHEARSLLERARAQADGNDLVARIDLSLAYVCVETGTLDEGVELCQGALDLPGLTDVTRGLIWSQLGLIRSRTGTEDEGIADLGRAIPLLAGEPEFLGRAYLNRGNIHLTRGEVDAAHSDLILAVETLAHGGSAMTAAKAEHNLGFVHHLAGNPVEALRAIDRAAVVLWPMSEEIRAGIQQDRAEVLMAAGRASEAIEALEGAIAAYGHEKLRRFQAECEFVLARTVLGYDPARALTAARGAMKRFHASGNPSWALRAEAVAAMASVRTGSATRSTAARADELVPLLRDGGFRADADNLSLHIARLAVNRRDLEDAQERLGRVKTSSDSLITTRLLSREVHAELATAQGHPSRAREYARKGLDELHSWQSTFGSLDLQTSAVGHGQHLARLGLRGALADGRAAIVFDWSERARALASRVSSLRPPPDPDLAADLTALRLADPSDHALRRELRERIRAHSWFAAQGTVGEPVSLTNLQERLAADDSALLAHIVLDGTITALAVTANDAMVVPLTEAAPVRALLDRVAADLDFAAQNRGGEVAAAVRTSLRADLAKLADILIRPVLATIGYRRLVLTPSALLTGTPWTELPGLIGRPVTVPTSATAWMAQATQPIRDVRETGFLAGPRLARAEEEVRRAHASWPRGHVLAGDEADSTRAGWLAARVDLLHIAGHGTHPGDHPLFAAVELADGPWFGHDIDLLPRVPEVVVLSACELGQSSVLHGEESVGMSAVWLHAGARAVVSSLALVADDLACEAFASWHHLVAHGVAPADALAQVSAATDDVVPFLCFGAGW